MLHAERSRPEAMMIAAHKIQRWRFDAKNAKSSAPDQSLLTSNDNKQLITHNIHYTTLSLFIQKQPKSTFRKRVENATRMVVQQKTAHILTSMIL